MDVTRKWTDRDIEFAEAVVQALDQMRVAPGWSGYDARKFAVCHQWMRDLVEVMKNPPIPAPVLKPKEEHKQPARVEVNNAGKQSGAVKKASKNTGSAKTATRKKARS